MSEKPGDFFLGVIDFFGILVPGIALLILQGSTLAQLAAISVPQAHNWWDWVPAVVAAYVAGQFLLGLGVPLNRLASLVFPEAKSLYLRTSPGADPMCSMQRSPSFVSKARVLSSRWSDKQPNTSCFAASPFSLCSTVCSLRW
jgi:hypothetical protein